LYKLILVDDESGQLEIMESIIADICPSFELKSFDNSIKALEYIRKNSVDAVISDIRMPVMDGLQLSEQISKLKPEIVVAIISAYSDFEYAQRSIDFGVIGYLIKPVSISKITELMEKIENILSQRAESQDKINNLNRQLDSYRHVYIEKQLKDWLMGSTDNESYDMINSVFTHNKSGLVISSRLDLYSDSVNKTCDVSQIISFYKASIRKLFSNKASVLTVLYDDHRLILVSVIGSSIVMNPEIIQNNISQLIRGIKSEFNIDIKTGLSDIEGNIIEKLQLCLKQALQALDYTFLLTSKDYVCYFEVKALQQISDTALYLLENKIMDRFRSFNLSGIKEHLQAFLESYTGGAYYSPSHVLHEHFLHIALSAKKHVQYNAADTIIEKMNSARSVNTLCNVLYNYLEELVNFQKDRSDAATGDVLESIKQYINNNYKKDISLEMMAENFHFNPSYISLLFKTYFRTGFKEYLIDVRINEAKRLLSETNMKVYEVAQNIGYNDVAYFDKLFKKEVGISPNKYRSKAD